MPLSKRHNMVEALASDRRPPPPRQIVYAAGGCLLISLLAPFVIFPGFRWLWECVCGIFPDLGPSW